MKNISRRVFIKGMAVAAAATAASTVLAGCNFVPGTEGETEVVPAPANTHTFKDGDNTLTVSATKLETTTVGVTGRDGDKENVYIYVDVENKLGNDNGLYIWDNGYAGYEQYDQIGITYTLIGKDGQTIVKDAVPTGVPSAQGADSMFYGKGTGLLMAKNTKKSGYIYVGKVNDEWTKLELTVKYFKSYKTGSSYALDQLDKTTFTFNK